MELAASVLLDTTLITLTLALAAFGLAIIYGLIGVINICLLYTSDAADE